MKYRLKKWYPSLPKQWKVGEIVHQSYGPHCYSSTSPNIDYRINIPKEEVENNPEFWEPVVEKGCEILSFKRKTGELAKKGRIGGGKGYSREERFDCQREMYRPTEKELLENNEWNIHSVKRLSDGEIFTVGDKVGTKESTYNLIIKEIDFGIIHTKELFLYGEKRKRCVTNISLKKAYHLELLFTTEDGVDICEGDKYYAINKHLDSIECYNKNNIFVSTANEHSNTADYLTFSTREKAEQWIKNNKPRYSRNDIEKAMNKIGLYDMSKQSYNKSLWFHLNKIKQ